jgi:predicted O-linked N-acetylglucosamine transferase (SPINDLY family)
MSAPEIVRRLLSERRFDEACAASQALVDAHPNDAQARFLASISHAEAGRFAEAKSHMACALEFVESPPWAWQLAFVNILRDAGDLGEARDAGERLIQRDPNRSEAHNALGLTLLALGDDAAALASFELAIKANPTYVPAYLNAAAALTDTNRSADALTLIKAALARIPGDARLYVALGKAFDATADAAEARTAYGEAIRLSPASSFHALYRYGRLAYEQADMFAAISAYEAALKLKPEDAELWVWLGNAYLDVGAAAQAIRCLRQALLLRPDYPEVFDTLLVAYHYDPKIDANAMYEAHLEWRDRFAPAMNVGHSERLRGDGSKLRIAFVSRSLHQGAVPRFLDALMRHLPRDRFTIYLYDVGQVPLALVAASADECVWRSVGHLSDDDLVAKIQSDHIDVLIDLDGHVPGNRLRALSRKPAPMQVTWLDYFDTTGVEAFDYLIGDSVSTPLDSAQRFTEKILRLDPCRLCYSAPGYIPSPAPPPALRTGAVTFGSFNRLSKLSEAVLDRWTALLKVIPGSRLIVKNAALASVATREIFAQRFVLRGIARERLDLRGPSAHPAMLAEYGDVDIALDPHPYNGGLTSCEALFMGVPIVAMLGEAMISRQTASLLTAAGLTAWIARSDSQWIDLNVAMAADLDKMRTWRLGARGYLQATPLCDGRLFARKFSDLLLRSFAPRS